MNPNYTARTCNVNVLLPGDRVVGRDGDPHTVSFLEHQTSEGGAMLVIVFFEDGETDIYAAGERIMRRERGGE